MFSKKIFFVFVSLFIISGVILTFTNNACADMISPAQEQEFIDARNALESARIAGAEKFASDYFTLARDVLQKIDGARQLNDSVAFSRASLLARAYAELAKVSAELNIAREKLAATEESLQKAKNEIERLKSK